MEKAKRTGRVSFGLVPVLLGLLVGSGCSPKGSREGLPRVPTLTAEVPHQIQGSQDVPVQGVDEDHKIRLTQIGKTIFVHAHGVYSENAFNDLYRGLSGLGQGARQAALQESMRKTVLILERAGTYIRNVEPDLGFVSFLLPVQENDILGALKVLHFSREMTFEPDWFDYGSLKQAKAFKPETEGLSAIAATDNSEFSGLKRIGVPEFIKLAQKDIGKAANGDPILVNGSKARVGITDTGITLNHPAYHSLINAGKTRIDYLKDFTAEARVYFNPAAAFSAKEGATSTELLVNAQVLQTPRSPTLPAANDFKEIKDLKITVSVDLKKKLMDPNLSPGQVQLGFLREDSLQGDSEKVDFNANGKLDDECLMILVRGATPADDVVYFDPSGKNDLSTAAPLGEWNTTHATVKVFAELVGVSFTDDELPGLEDNKQKIKVRGVSIVGFDPGNHGSHVAGIAAASKIIQNEADDTLQRGVAPEASISLNRVCANNGGCNALEAFVDLTKNANVDVINMSIGGLSPLNDGYGSEETMINRLTSVRNTLFVISAGNSGPGNQTVGSPSVARLSLSVGASASKGMIQRQYQWPGGGAWLDPSNDEDFMLFFSSRGPTSAGGFKPNLAAPGTELSSVQLNVAPGGHGGLDVYWGTSMAAPTATGAYALFMDAVRKYNSNHSKELALPTDALTLRQVLISSAVPFDVTRFDPQSGDYSEGQYIWTDEGKGLINLPAAWKQIFKVRDLAPPSTVVSVDPVSGAQTPVALDYQVITSQAKNPSGQAYDGSRSSNAGPAFGAGLYLSSTSAETLVPVYLQRKLSAKSATAADAGDLTVQLETTQDEFELKTVFYGSKVVWLKAGVLSALDCNQAPTGNLKVTSQGVAVSVDAAGVGTLVPLKDSVLNVCLDRAAISQLPPGDHGAIIDGFRVVKGAHGKLVRDPIPSFSVPVSLTVPERVLENKTGYDFSGKAKSFDVKRHYVSVPVGTSLVAVTLEVPPFKAGVQGCSGVELMALLGDNSTKPYASRPEARIFNCAADGSPVTDEKKRKLTFFTHDPKAGIWNLHVFGSYSYVESDYRIKVDYLKSSSSIEKIEGGIPSLSGTFDWKVEHASFGVAPDSPSSRFILDGFYGEKTIPIKTGDTLFVESTGFGTIRKYPATTKSVRVATGGSSGNDLDLYVMECPSAVTDLHDKACKELKKSAGSTDEESVEFKPDSAKAYLVRVEGFSVEQGKDFVSTEEVTLGEEKGTVLVTPRGGDLYSIAYEFSAGAIQSSAILNASEVKSGAFVAKGRLELRGADGALFESLPVRIKP